MKTHLIFLVTFLLTISVYSQESKNQKRINKRLAKKEQRKLDDAAQKAMVKNCLESKSFVFEPSVNTNTLETYGADSRVLVIHGDTTIYWGGVINPNLPVTTYKLTEKNGRYELFIILNHRIDIHMEISALGEVSFGQAKNIKGIIYPIEESRIYYNLVEKEN